MKIWKSLVVSAAVAALNSVPAEAQENRQDVEQPSLPSVDLQLPSEARAARLTQANADIAAWSSLSALAARRIFDKYGAPDEIQPNYLAWDNGSPWTRTVVFNVAPAASGEDEPALIEQSLDCRLRPAQVAALASFDRRLAYDDRSGELSARSESEELNFLRMNLADDVIAGRRTPEGARTEFDRSVSLSRAGKTLPSMQRLHYPFAVPVE
jgi:hypothetical protein